MTLSDPQNPPQDDLREVFGQRGLRLTRQREEVYKSLAGTKLHPTAEELFECVRGKLSGVSLATVYNTLDAFVRVGLCRRMSCSSSGPCRYDADTSEHAHVVLPDGRFLDVPTDLSDRLMSRVTDDDLRELEQRLGVPVAGLSLQVIAAETPSK